MGKSSRGRPRNRLRDVDLKDIRVLFVKNWTKVVMDRSTWHELVETSKYHGELQEERRRRTHFYEVHYKVSAIEIPPNLEIFSVLNLK
jgi:hypothetical protein